MPTTAISAKDHVVAKMHYLIVVAVQTLYSAKAAAIAGDLEPYC